MSNDGDDKEDKVAINTCETVVLGLGLMHTSNAILSHTCTCCTVIAKTTSFANSNLQGCRFYKAYLVGADFTGADLRGASLEDTSMDDAILKNANAAGAYFSASILDAKTLENADFTDAQFPLKIVPQLCLRDDVKGTNPTTGVDTRDSLMCP